MFLVISKVKKVFKGFYFPDNTSTIALGKNLDFDLNKMTKF